MSKELSPKIEGVVVIADGGENAVVKENISSAVQALFDIEQHKIRIMKKQTNLEQYERAGGQDSEKDCDCNAVSNDRGSRVYELLWQIIPR